MNIIGRTAARWLCSVSVLATVVLVADAARAGEPAATSIRLQLAQHALDTPRGVAVTYLRIREAARSVCGYADHAFHEEQSSWNDCVAATIHHTVVQIGNPRLSDFYVARSHETRNHSNEDSLIGSRLP